jgi:hypothetical protein
VITGIVAGRHALVRLVLRGPSQQEAEIEFVLDTGRTDLPICREVST